MSNKLTKTLASILVGVPLLFGTGHAQQPKETINLEEKVTRLTNNDFPDGMPVYSPDGKQIVFVSMRNEEEWGLYSMDSDGSREKQIKNFKQEEEMEIPIFPSWSPDGKRIVYTLFNFEGDNKSQIYTIDTNKNEMKKLLDAEFDFPSPAYSPDRKQIVYAGVSKDEIPQTYIMNSDGSNPKQLTNSLSGGVSPTWSPDGKKIALIGEDEDGKGGIYIINPDGNQQKKLIGNLELEFEGFIWNKLAWSPDSKQIAFTSKKDGNPEIYTLNIDTKRLKRITYNSADDYFPEWSPDGKHIIFASDRDGDNDYGSYEIYTIDIR